MRVQTIVLCGLEGEGEDEKSRYLSVCMGFLYTEVEMDLPSSCRSSRSRKGSCPLVLISTVKWM